MIDLAQIEGIKRSLYYKDIYCCVGQDSSSRDKFLFNLFYEVFEKFPHMFYINGNRNKILNGSYEENLKEVQTKTIRKTVNLSATIVELLNLYPDCYVEKTNYNVLYIIGDYFILADNIIYSAEQEMPKEFWDCIVYEDEEESVYIVTYDGYSFIDTPIKIKKYDNIKDNYNDDLPEDKIEKILSDDDSSIILFHGEAGTGKTSYIRNLVHKFPDLSFHFLDPSILGNITNTAFLDYIIENKKAIYIMEDCENLLKSRETDFNPFINTLLNISDGLIGDFLGVKFICTFNTSINNIDKAILRKGRMKLKYEFKKLAKDKVANLFKKLGLPESEAKEMALCDIYNYLEDNGNKQERKRIGFC